jgi:hypothetical protein
VRVRNVLWPEFVARALLEWIADQRIETALIDPGKPWKNGVGESFNGKFPRRVPEQWSGSAPEPRPRPSSKLGATTTTRFARIRASAIDAGGVRRKAQERRSSRLRNGPGRWAQRGLRAPARCNTVLEGTIERAADAGSLNLTGRSKVKYPSTMAMTSRSSPAAQLLQQPAKGQEWSVQGSWHANPRLFVRGRTVASTLARRGLPMSPRHWCCTERDARTSSTTPTPVISSHNTCGQLSGLKFPASGWSWPS